MKPTLLILAAGIGSRYGGLKQVEPVGPSGEIVVDYSVYDAIRAGFGRVVFVIRKDLEDTFRSTVLKRFEDKIRIDLVFQELDSLPAGRKPPSDRTKPWSTGHAVLVAQNAIQEPFAAINADDFYGRHSFAVLSEFLQKAIDPYPAEFAMVGFTLRNTLSEHGHVSRGISYCDEHGYLRNIAEHTQIQKSQNRILCLDSDGVTKQLSGVEVVSMNTWGFTPFIFEALGNQFEEFLIQNGQNPKAEFYLPAVVDRMIARKLVRVKVLPTQSHWLGVTYKEDRPAVAEGIRRLVEAGEYPEKLWA